MGDDIARARDALVELELLGFEFRLQGDDLRYRPARRPPNPALVEDRLGLVRAHKEPVKQWLARRTRAEVEECAERITTRIVRHLHDIRLLCDCHQRAADGWLEALSLVEANLDRVRDAVPGPPARSTHFQP